MNEGLERIEKFPSRASDSGSALRRTKHWLAHVRNTAAVRQEVCDTEALATLIGPLDTLITTDSFTYYAPYDHINEIHIQINPITQLSTFFKNQIKTSTTSTCRLYVVAYDKNNKPIKEPVPHKLHWLYRGKELQDLSRYEYYSIIQIKKLQENDFQDSDDECDAGDFLNDECQDEKGSTGRKKSKKYYFHHDHPLFETHYQCIYTKMPTVIPTGSPPPFPGDDPCSENPTIQQQWHKQRDEFAYYYLTLFRPEPSNYDGNIHDASYCYDDLILWLEKLTFSEFLIDYFGLKMVD